MFRPFLQTSRCPNPPPELRQEAGCSQGWCRGITGPITLSEGWWESSSNSLEPGSHFLSKWGYVNTIHHSQGFWAGNRHGCSPRKSTGMNSPEWPPSPASLSEDQSAADSLQQGWRAGSILETRCHLSLERQGTKHPITYLTSCPRVTGWGNLGL